MTDARKRRGRQSEHVVADYLRRNGFDFAEAVGAGRSGTDVTGTPGIDWEVKARRGLNLAGLLYIVGAESPAAALALADTILGVES